MAKTAVPIMRGGHFGWFRIVTILLDGGQVAAPANGRITLARLTEAGYAKLVASAPAHVETVRRLVIDALTKQQSNQLGRVSGSILAQLNAPGERPSRQSGKRQP